MWSRKDKARSRSREDKARSSAIVGILHDAATATGATAADAASQEAEEETEFAVYECEVVTKKGKRKAVWKAYPFLHYFQIGRTGG